MKRTLPLMVFALISIILGCEQQNSVSPVPQETKLVSRKAAHPTNFHFVGLTKANIIDGVHHTMFMAGDGVILRRKVVGNGTFQHTDTDPSKPLPKPIFGEGSWQAQRLVSFKTVGVYGVGVAGILKMEIVLVPNNGEPAIPATLEVVCNIPPGNLFTGKAEGYTLTPQGAPFGSFAALVPPIGVTWFTNTAE